MIRNILIVLTLSCFLSADTIEYEPYENYVDGYRVVIGGKINDNFGVYDARVYFKDKKQKIYHLYSPMKCKGDSCFASIPLTAKGTKGFDYIIVYQNNAAKIYKSRELQMNAKDMVELPSWQSSDKTRLFLKTELVKIPKQLYGFNDKVRIEPVDDSEKLGCLTGVVNCDAAGIKDSSIISGEIGGKLGFVGVKDDESSKSSLLSSPYTIGGIILLLLML